MNKDLEKTQELIKAYKEKPEKESFKEMVLQVQNTTFLIPATLPADIDRDEIRKRAIESAGMPSKLPEGVKPFPCILKNEEGKVFFPIYTAQEQIPTEPKYDVIITIPFRACMELAGEGKFNAEGIVLNPFSDNLLLEKKLLEALKKEDELRAAGAKQVQVTPQQFRVMMRQKAEFHDFPMRAFKEGAEFIHKIDEQQETFVHEIYREAFQNTSLYPYTESDFEVMSLNISEDLLLIRVDVPPVKEAARLCYRIYVTMNPQTEEIHYFTIERGKEKGTKNIVQITGEGKQILHGEAPVEGAEIQRVMDLIKNEKEMTS